MTDNRRLIPQGQATVCVVSLEAAGVPPADNLQTAAAPRSHFLLEGEGWLGQQEAPGMSHRALRHYRWHLAGCLQGWAEPINEGFSPQSKQLRQLRRRDRPFAWQCTCCAKFAALYVWSSRDIAQRCSTISWCGSTSTCSAMQSDHCGRLYHSSLARAPAAWLLLHQQQGQRYSHTGKRKYTEMASLAARSPAGTEANLNVYPALSQAEAPAERSHQAVHCSQALLCSTSKPQCAAVKRRCAVKKRCRAYMPMSLCKPLPVRHEMSSAHL